MKVIYGLLLVLAASIGMNTMSCPTCVGRVSRKSAPFFSDECYRQAKKQPRKKHVKQPIEIDMTTTP
jgi:hypothetical protein